MDMFINYMIDKNTLQKLAKKIKILLLLRNFLPINNSLKLGVGNVRPAGRIRPAE